MLIQLFGAPTVPSKKGLALLLSLIGIPLCLIVIIYNVLTFWFKYLIITKDGITDKMSLFGCRHIHFEEIDSIRFWLSHLTIKHNQKTKIFSCLKISIEQKKIIDKLYIMNKKSHNQALNTAPSGRSDSLKLAG